MDQVKQTWKGVCPETYAHSKHLKSWENIFMHTQKQ